jgi:hypothetical protein
MEFFRIFMGGELGEGAEILSSLWVGSGAKGRYF